LILYLIVPCYNEQEVLNQTAKILRDKLNKLIQENKISNQSKIMFIDDGSRDQTWNIILKLNQQEKIFSGIKLSRNRGHQNALLAGLLSAKDLCDITISLDADLQDDINTIDKMLEEYKNGYEIIYGVRDSRQTDSFFKKTSAQFFYRFMKFIGCEIIFNHADFRLISKRALEDLNNFHEVNLFLRGIIPMIGYKSCIVNYARQKRMAGKSKYSFRKMLEFAIDGITSLSVKPIRFIFFIYFLIALSDFILGLAFFMLWIFMHRFNWLLCLSFIFLFTTSLHVLSIALVGEYISKIYLETKQRPRFIIEKFLN